jgi:serine/threonine protein kinase
MKPLGYFIASELFNEILEGVDYLHTQNIIHRDLKPSNILVTEGKNGRFVKLADFGLSKIQEINSRSHTKGLGTPGYMVPEVAYNRHYNKKADIYSIGIIVQQLFNIGINEYLMI